MVYMKNELVSCFSSPTRRSRRGKDLLLEGVSGTQHGRVLAYPANQHHPDRQAL
jgi:hypothetical protein